MLTAKNAWGYDMPEPYSTLIEPVPGNSLTLTIDASIQHWLESAVAAAVQEHNVASRGVGIVMDVNTGAILAMTSQPDYDPNDPRTILDETLRAEIDTLTGEARSEALQTAQQAQWRNKAISDLYEPGSVFKLITARLRWMRGRLQRFHLCLCGQDPCFRHDLPLCERPHSRNGNAGAGVGGFLQSLLYPGWRAVGQTGLL